jgi:hypothetical protein
MFCPLFCVSLIQSVRQEVLRAGVLIKKLQVCGHDGSLKDQRRDDMTVRSTACPLNSEISPCEQYLYVSGFGSRYFTSSHHT